MTTPWLAALPEQYRDRVQYDADDRPSCIDVAAGSYTVPGPLTEADRAACGLPPGKPGRSRRGV